MAAIDKIYGTPAQYYEFRAWCANHCPAAVDYFYPERYALRTDTNGKLPLTNFPERIDMWMLENCTLEWVVEYIMWQYNLKRTEQSSA